MQIQNLVDCFINEKNTKSFLKYNKEVIDYFYKRLNDQRENLKTFLKGESKIIKSIYELEMERIEYMIREYLLIRIEKMKGDSFINLELLSSEEIIFYEKLRDQLPYKNKRDGDPDVVGFICNKDLGNVLLEGESVEMNKDDFYVGPMSDIYDLVNSGDVKVV